MNGGTVIINGKKYDAQTGALIEGIPKSPKIIREPVNTVVTPVIETAHRKPSKSRTLNRNFVTAPKPKNTESIMEVKTTPITTPKPITKTTMHPKVQHFTPRIVMDITPPQVKHNVSISTSNVRAQEKAIPEVKTIKSEPIKQKPTIKEPEDHIEEILTKPTPEATLKRKKIAPKNPKNVILSAIATCVILVIITAIWVLVLLKYNKML